MESINAQAISEEEKLSQIKMLSEEINDALREMQKECLSKKILWSDIEVLLYKSM